MARSTLLVAATGTQLSQIAASLKGDSVQTIDVEARICKHYSEQPRFARGNRTARMFQVAMYPRGELLELWRKTARAISKEIAQAPEGERFVVAAHLFWLNANTNEFFCPVDLRALKSMAIDRIVVLVDDIYDMFARLSSPDELYAPIRIEQSARLLRKLSFSAPTGTPEALLVEDRSRKEALEQALGDLLTFRRAEMIQAEHLALRLKVPLTVLGVKHTRAALSLLTTGQPDSVAYLSHRITEVRGMNKRTASLPHTLGVWAPCANEVNELHAHFAEHGHVLINPTAIDELRIASPTSPADQAPYFSARWPLGHKPDAMIVPTTQANVEHTELLALPTTSEDVSPLDFGPVRALSRRIFFEIAFRDHFIVEHTGNLLVHRPFFCDNDPGHAGVADWSGGVRPEIEHWMIGAPTKATDVPRRAAFIHTDLEVVARMEYLRGDRYHENFVVVLKDQLRGHLKDMNVNPEQIQCLLEGRSPDANNSHLSMHPPHLFDEVGEGLPDLAATYGVAALQKWYTTMARPSENAHGGKINLDIALILATEDEDRSIRDLGGVARETSAFLGGRLPSDELSVAFWERAEAEFQRVFGVSISDASLAAIGWTADSLAIAMGARK